MSSDNGGGWLIAIASVFAAILFFGFGFLAGSSSECDKVHQAGYNIITETSSGGPTIYRLEPKKEKVHE